ncbi:hypothetical protein [Dermacoccus sp. Tok2021]|uniref:hypothetical protein n=1 Tax=Dermacoccus sp. Tok2021 TaxID=2826873 RepID=UPI001CA714C8|nr:hypothetical protein [Dermacoccus sp. Tok2021]MBZ4497955.1 hypothetical protein [Dermacoccus sp. Tok2021]
MSFHYSVVPAIAQITYRQRPLSADAESLVYSADFWGASVGVTAAFILGLGIMSTALIYHMEDEIQRRTPRKEVVWFGSFLVLALCACGLGSVWMLWRSLISLAIGENSIPLRDAIGVLTGLGLLFLITFVMTAATAVARVKDGIDL